MGPSGVRCCDIGPGEDATLSTETRSRTRRANQDGPDARVGGLRGLGAARPSCKERSRGRVRNGASAWHGDGHNSLTRSRLARAGLLRSRRLAWQRRRSLERFPQTGKRARAESGVMSGYPGRPFVNVKRTELHTFWGEIRRGFCGRPPFVAIGLEAGGQLRAFRAAGRTTAALGKAHGEGAADLRGACVQSRLGKRTSSRSSAQSSSAGKIPAIAA